MSLIARVIRRVSLLARLAAYRMLSVVGHESFVRFIILTRSRTGSNLLLSFLNSHPNIFVEGEIFATMRGKDPMARLRVVFGKQPRHVLAKGFKVFYYHPLDAKADELWKRLEQDEEIRVIHLTRENILRTLLSRKIAGMKDSWTGTRFDAADPDRKRVTMTVEELEEGFRQTRAWEQAAAARFRSHPLVQVTYEGMTSSPREIYAKLLAFLGVTDCDPRTSLSQQNPECLRTLIRNYDELKRAFAGSAWEQYFDEPYSAEGQLPDTAARDSTQ